MQSWSWVKNVHFSKALTPFISLLHIVLFYFLSCHCVLPSRLFVPWHFLKRSRCIVAFFDALSGCVCKDVCRLAISNWPFNQFQLFKWLDKWDIFEGKPFRQTFHSWFHEKSIFVQPWQFIITSQFNSHPLTYSYSKKFRDSSWWGQQDHLRWM